MGVSQSQNAPPPLLSLATRGLGQYTTLQEVEQAMQKDFASPRSSSWVMLDEENAAEFEEVEAEGQRRNNQRRRAHERGLNPVESKLLRQDRKGSDFRSRSVRSAKAESQGEGRRPKFEFVDVPARRQANSLGRNGVLNGRNRSESVQNSS